MRKERLRCAQWHCIAVSQIGMGAKKKRATVPMHNYLLNGHLTKKNNTNEASRAVSLGTMSTLQSEVHCLVKYADVFQV